MEKARHGIQPITFSYASFMQTAEEGKAKNLRLLHFEFSRQFPSSTVLHLQGSAALLLKKRLNELRQCPSLTCKPVSYHLSPSILTNPTEILTQAPMLIPLYEQEINRTSVEQLSQTHHMPVREQKCRRC